MKLKLLGIGDLFIPAEIIAKGFKELEANDIDVRTVDWAMNEEAELQRINSIVESRGCEAVEPPDYVYALAKDADIIATQFCTITRQLIDNCPKLKVIGVLRAGCENVNVEYASKRGIVVLNTPGRNADAVADFTVGMMIAEARNIAKGHAALKNGNWVRQYSNSDSIPDMCGKTVGLIGFGQIGRKVAKRLSGFDMTICCYDPYVTEFPEGVECLSLEEIMSISDFISIHVRSSKKTEKLISIDMIAKMKPTAYLINTSRPSIVDENALIDALKHKRIAGAALDVFSIEPPGINHPLVRLDNVTLTPHMAGGTKDAFYNSPKKMAAELRKLWQKGSLPPTNILNKEVYERKMMHKTAHFE